MSEHKSSPGLGAAGPEASNVDFNDVFSLRRPKDAKAGLASGLKSIAKGVLGGATALLAAPVVGAHREGVAGFAKGLASGVVGAVVLPVAGVTVGAVQMARGIMNQPEAIAESSRGKIWDEETRSWFDKDAIVAVESPGGGGAGAMQRGARGAGGRGGALSRPAPGEDYYAILQVPRDASPDAIRRQYYLLARRWHPDKNPGDATAHDQFQKLGEAYQVLSNPQLRAQYDAHGSAGLEVDLMDGGAFFGALFGSDLFEHLVGELLIAAAARNGGELSAADMAREQAARAHTLATHLRALLKRFTAGDEEGFAIAMRAEADRLAAASFGETMLHAIGRVYEACADIAGGGFFAGVAAKLRQQGDSVKSQFAAASAAIKAYSAQQRIEAWQREQDRRAALAAVTAAAGSNAAAAQAAGQAAGQGQAGPEAAGGDQAKAAAQDASSPADTAPGPAPGSDLDSLLQRRALEEAALPLMLEAMWAANVLDIQATLRRVCAAVLEEAGVAKAELAARAAALKLLGRIFIAARAPAGQGAGQGPCDARRAMEEAMMRVAERRGAAEEAEEGEEAR